MNLKEAHDAAVKAAHDYIEDLQSKGDVTEQELKRAEELTAAAKEAGAKVKRNEGLRALETGLPRGDEAASVLGGPHAGKAWASKSLEKIRTHGARFGTKALVGGSIDIPKIVFEAVPLGQRPFSVLQIIPQVPLLAGAAEEFGASTFTFLRQTARTTNATAVADGATKPTSTYTWDDTSDRVRVYAHLSEELPERFISDYRHLEELLQGEMFTGLLDKIEADIIAGPVQGTGVERFTGILNTSGIQTVAAVTGDILATLSNGYFALTTAGETPTHLILNPLDLQKLLLLREGGSTGALLFGSGRTSIEQVIGAGVTIVDSTRVSAGTAIIGDFQQAALVVREEANLAVDRSGARFEKNLFIVRVEGRYGFVLKRPAAFAKITLPSS